MLNQKGKIISIAAVVGVLLAAYGVFIYQFVFPKDDNQNSDDKLSVSTSLNPSKIRLDVQSGNISSDKKMLLTLKLSGLDGKDAIEELRKDGNIKIEVDQKSANIQSTETVGEDALLILAQTDIGDDKFKGFNDGKLQVLEVRTDLYYGTGNTASKMISRDFKKSLKKSSLGQEIAFGDRTETNQQTESTLVNKPRAVTPKPQTETLKRQTETQMRRQETQSVKQTIDDDNPVQKTVKKGKTVGDSDSSINKTTDGMKKVKKSIE